MDLQALESEYRAKEPLFQRLKEEAKFILVESLASRIETHDIHARVKPIESFLSKVRRKQQDAASAEEFNPFTTITDIVGLRVVCLFLSDLPQIGQMIRSSFNVQSEDNKLDSYDVSSFGYMSVHFVAKLKADHVGPRYEGLHVLPFEIQVRTIAMDAWANISHHLYYKGGLDTPRELQKDFFALSGLFYVADTHFEMFYRERQQALRKLEQDMNERGPKYDRAINFDSLSAYLNSRFPDRPESDHEAVSDFIRELSKAGYTSIREIDDAVERTNDFIQQVEQEYSAWGWGYAYFTRVGAARVALEIVDDDFRELRGISRKGRFQLYRKLLGLEV